MSKIIVPQLSAEPERCEPGGEQPGFGNLPSDRWPAAATGLFVLAIVYTLYFAAGLLVPIALAIFISITCSPIVRYLARWHIPKSLSAALVVAAIMSVTAFAVLALAGPAEKWLNDAPRAIRGLQDDMLPAKGPMADFQELADEVNELAKIDAPKKTPSVVIQGPGMLENVVGGIPSMLASVGVVIFLSFFLMSSGDSILRKTTRCGRSWSERRRIVSTARSVQSDISRYLAAVTLINILLGAAAALLMQLLHMPNPLLWGAMVAVLNFAPYIGALVSATVLTFVALTTFPGLGEALVVPGSFPCADHPGGTGNNACRPGTPNSAQSGDRICFCHYLGLAMGHRGSFNGGADCHQSQSHLRSFSVARTVRLVLAR